MKQKLSPHFIIIDDDLFANSITEMFIKDINEFPDIPVQTFRNVNDGLKFIQDNYNNPEAPLTILLLDLNMPTINGWGFLEEFENFNSVVKAHFKICFYSSSIISEDHERAFQNKHVIDFFIKPIKRDEIISLIHRVYRAQ